MPVASKINTQTNKQYDVIIIGGSYAGLAAGMALGRALRKVLIIDSGNPCNKQTPHSHNFLTNDGKTPGEISGIAKQQVLMYSSVTIINALATAAKKYNGGFEVEVENHGSFFSKKLVLATGVKDMLPAIPGLSESWGITVLHCPYCHGYEVRNKNTGILANGDMAYEFSSLISNWTNKLTLYTNGISSLTGQQVLKLTQHHINVVEKEIESLQHINGHIENIIFKDGTKADIDALYTRPPFIQHSSISQELGCELTEEGYIKINAAHKTTIDGVFACGDNTTRIRTVANAVAMGTTTGLMVNKELIEENF